MQFGSKPLFENISVKFGGGNRYGLIGANGSGKSTFMKILGGDWSRRSATYRSTRTSVSVSCVRISSPSKSSPCSTP
jgi:ATPase subunit of ABC transporter with duplicated ATPase domains